MGRNAAASFAVVIGLVTAGCAPYRAQPLTPETAYGQLQVPNEASLRVAASTFHHPLLPPVALDLTDGISPEEAALIAVLANPALRAAREERGIARANLIAAGILPDPTLDFQADMPVAGKTSEEVTGYTLGLGLDLQALITRGVDRRAARSHLAQVDLDIAWQEWQVAQQARLQVLRLAYLQRASELARRNEQDLAANAATLHRADSLHLVTVVEVGAAETAFESARQERLSAEAEQSRARSALNQALGLPVDSTVALQAGTVRSSFLVIPSAREMLDSLQKRRLDLVALRRGYESQEATLQAAILRQFPALTIGPVGTRDTGGFFTLGPMLSFGLPFFDRNRGQIGVERATHEQLYREYVARLFQTRHEVDSLLVERTLTGGQIEAAQRLVEARRRLANAYRLARRAGNADIVTYYQVLGDLYSAEMELLRLEQTHAELEIALEVASGTYFPPATGP